jgi:hypothetical protein
MRAMKEVDRISLLPDVPAVYALYGGQGRSGHVAYVGIADRLRPRIEQHLVQHSRSVTTGSSAAGLNAEHITELCWWADSSFKKSPALQAAELIAFEVLDPVLRSRGRVPKQAKQLFDDETFHNRLRTLFEGQPAGRLLLPRLQDALDRIAMLEHRVEYLERHLVRRPDRRA